MRRYVLGFAFSKDKKNVVLIKKNNPEWQRGYFNGIGGKLEQGETSYSAMIREFKEETSVYNEDWNYVGVMYNDGFSVEIFSVYTDDIFNCKTVEEEEIHIFEVSQLNKIAVISNLKWIIPMILDTSDSDYYYKGVISNNV